MSPLVVFILFFVFLLIAIPISVSLGLVAVLPGVFDPSFTASASYVIRSMFGGIDSFPLLAVPMFILSGIIMARGGISKRLFDLFSFFIGKRTAGLPCAAVITCLFYGAISGSGIATVAAVGSMTIPLYCLSCSSRKSWCYYSAKYPIHHVWYGIWSFCK